jgi:hypothetical protein
MVTPLRLSRATFACAFVALASLARPAAAAPAGAPVVQVIELWEPNLDQKAQALTNSLRELIFDAGDFVLNTDNPLLLPAAQDARCDMRGFDAALTETSDKGMNKTCLERMAKRLGAKGGFFWGYVFTDAGGRRMVKAHLWQHGEDRSVILSYDDRDRKRLAERLYRHLVSPGKVGDVTFTVEGGAPKGELVVNGRAAGAFEGGAVELTLPLGAVSAEVRSGEKVLARGSGTVAALGLASVRLQMVPEPPPPPPVKAPPTEGFREPSPIVIKPRRSALPWVVGGVGVAGLVGAGVFYALRQGKESDLDQACGADACPPRAQDDIDGSKRYGTLSLVSLGFGVAGLATSAVLFATEGKRREAAGSAFRVHGFVMPQPGGGAAALVGSF